ncbi:winged helix-turn-helix transcriptional regulator [Enterobacteriaceae bacterium 4M9]|nr:winged helix-turn-helix transcriptional regulator [Enterobacteriaceae bacterium 4M9]
MSFELNRFLPYLLSVASAQVSRRFAECYTPVSGLNVPEWRVLAHLYREGEVSVRDINVRVNLDKSMVSRAATRLEEAGLLHKTGNNVDRRLIVLALTADGQALMQRLEHIADDFQATLIKALGDDAEAVTRALEKLSQFGNR